QACVKEGLPFYAKMVANSNAKRGGNTVLEDPCEPKIVFYFNEGTSKESKEKLRQFVELVERCFTQEEMEKEGCKTWQRNIWAPSSDGSTYIQQVLPQDGPSFTRMRNKLVYYTQGGFTESGRVTHVTNRFNKQELERQFEGENYYRYS